MAYAFAERWERGGHRVLHHRGLHAPPAGDVAIAHVDLTVVPEAYRALQARYPRVVNGAVADISKRRYSDCVLARGTPWNGPVIVKTDANYSGQVENSLRRLATEAGRATDIPVGPVMTRYPIYQSAADVPGKIWDMPGINVEKLVPEQDERGFYLRVWTFFGSRERTSRYLSHEVVIKSSSYIEREVVVVPDEMRELRARLGFDYGKFDYVRHDGRFYLLDANRTPAAPAQFVSSPDVVASLDQLAAGIDGFLSTSE